MDPEEGGPTEEQSKFQSIGIQVEDERGWVEEGVEVEISLMGGMKHR